MNVAVVYVTKIGSEGSAGPVHPKYIITNIKFLKLTITNNKAQRDQYEKKAPKILIDFQSTNLLG